MIGGLSEHGMSTAASHRHGGVVDEVCGGGGGPGDGGGDEGGLHVGVEHLGDRGHYDGGGYHGRRGEERSRHLVAEVIRQRIDVV